MMTLAGRPVSAVVFDCDGVLADTEPLAVATWTTILQPHGHRPSEVQVQASMGRTFEHVRDLYAVSAPELPTAVELAPIFDAIYLATLQTSISGFADSLALVHRLHSQQIPLAVASSSPRRRLALTLQLLDIAQLFQVSVAGDEVDNPKPAADPYLLAAAGLGVCATQCVAIEDSNAGVRSAKAAGMFTIGVLREPTADLAAADLVVLTLADLDLISPTELRRKTQ